MPADQRSASLVGCASIHLTLIDFVLRSTNPLHESYMTEVLSAYVMTSEQDEHAEDQM